MLLESREEGTITKICAKAKNECIIKKMPTPDWMELVIGRVLLAKKKKKKKRKKKKEKEKKNFNFFLLLVPIPSPNYLSQLIQLHSNILSN